MGSMHARLSDGSLQAPTATAQIWWRRLVGYFFGVIVPWSILSQLLGTLIFNRSWPDGTSGAIVGGTAFIAIIILTSALAGSGQSPAHKLLGLQVLTTAGHPASRRRLLVRNVAHIIDFATFGLGFLYALGNTKGQTFADMLVRTTVNRIPHRSKTS